MDKILKFVYLLVHNFRILQVMPEMSAVITYEPTTLVI